ncbi:MAG: DUF2147 domain-containing protein [Treponema sp.]|nr:DUF2147 domain-containing protein [Treponema sp.]
MKKKIISFILSGLMLATAFAADPATGLWKSIDDKSNKVTAIWSLYEDNGKLFGKILAVADAPQDSIATKCKKSYKGFPIPGEVNKMQVVGTTWIFNMEKESEGNWSKGNVIDPEKGSMYGCVIKYLAPGKKHKSFTAKEETLAMAGTVGPIKVFQYWSRATESDIKELQEKFPAKK